jgi:hypothetical protein
METAIIKPVNPVSAYMHKKPILILAALLGFLTMQFNQPFAAAPEPIEKWRR